jgi:hypothetical protein
LNEQDIKRFSRVTAVSGTSDQSQDNTRKRIYSSITDASDASQEFERPPQKKIRRVAAAGMKLENLPPELRSEIFKFFVVENGASASKNLSSWLLTSKPFYNTASDLINRSIVKNVESTLNGNRLNLDKFPYENKPGVRQDLRMMLLEHDADTIPILNYGGRVRILKDALSHEGDNFPDGVFQSISSNVRYYDPESRSAIVQRVCVRHREQIEFEEDDTCTHQMLGDLIGQADLLRPEDHQLLISVSCNYQVTTHQRELLDAWAPRMNVLGEEDQNHVIRSITEDGDGRARSLSYFAEHTDKLSSSLSSASSLSGSISDSILAMSSSETGRSKALSHLLEHLEYYDEPKQRIIVLAGINNVKSPVAENVDDEQPWYSHPSFCAAECLHYLNKNGSVLTKKEHDEVEDLTNGIMAGFDNTKKIQLIAGMPGSMRANFVRDTLRLPYTRAARRDMHLTLAARVDELLDDEKLRYVSNMSKSSSRGTLDSEVIDYNVCNNLGKFGTEQRRDLVGLRLDAIREDANAVGPAIANLTMQAHLLVSSDINQIIEDAKDISQRYMEDLVNGELDREQAASIRSCFGDSVRCLGHWSDEKLREASMPDRIQEQAGLDRVTKNPLRYDARPVDRERSPQRSR